MVKSSTGTLVGDTMYHKSTPVDPLPGFRPAKAMVGSVKSIFVPSLYKCIWVYTKDTFTDYYVDIATTFMLHFNWYLKKTQQFFSGLRFDKCLYNLDVYVTDKLTYSCLHFQVFAGIYPIDQSQYDKLRESITKLTFNDSSVSVTQDFRYSNNHRFGFRWLYTNICPDLFFAPFAPSSVGK